MATSNPWQISWRADPRGRALADRHYSRQTHGAESFVQAGKVLVLVHPADYLGGADAVWSTLWPFAEYVAHAWAGDHPNEHSVWRTSRGGSQVRETPGNWMNTIFRNESPLLSSELIRYAVAATRAQWPDYVPDGGMITMIQADSVESGRKKGRHAIGWSYRKAGFREVGITQAKPQKVVFQLAPEDMPDPLPAQSAEQTLAMF